MGWSDFKQSMDLFNNRDLAALLSNSTSPHFILASRLVRALRVGSGAQEVIVSLASSVFVGSPAASIRGQRAKECVWQRPSSFFASCRVSMDQNGVQESCTGTLTSP